jgi:hypothetical protein
LAGIEIIRKESKMFHNVVIGTPIIEPEKLIALDDKDWETNEKEKTLFTDIRFLPAIMKEAGIVNSTSEVRKNKPELMVTLNELDCLWIKWGKKFLYIIVGN